MGDEAAIVLLCLLITVAIAVGTGVSYRLYQKLRTERNPRGKDIRSAAVTTGAGTIALRTRHNSMKGGGSVHKVWEMAPLSLGLRQKIIQSMTHIQTHGIPFTLQQEEKQEVMWLPRGGGAWVSGSFDAVSQDMFQLSSKVKQLWRAKRGDVVEEMLANLPFPDKPHPHVLLRELSDRLWERCGHHHPTKSSLTLLLMLFYTQEIPDADRILLFDAPVWAEGNMPNREVWDAYLNDEDSRDGGLRAEMDDGMQDLLRSLRLDDSYNRRLAERKVSRWVKFLCTICALTVSNSFYKHKLTLQRQPQFIPADPPQSPKKSSKTKSSPRRAHLEAEPPLTRPPVLYKTGLNIPKECLGEFNATVEVPVEGMGGKRGSSRKQRDDSVTFDSLGKKKSSRNLDNDSAHHHNTTTQQRYLGWGSPLTCSLRADAVRPKVAKAEAAAARGGKGINGSAAHQQNGGKHASLSSTVLLRFHGVDSYLDFTTYASQSGYKTKADADPSAQYGHIPAQDLDTAPLGSSEAEFLERKSDSVYSPFPGYVGTATSAKKSRIISDFFEAEGDAKAPTEEEGEVFTVSQYPDEHGVVIPPFSVFSVTSVLFDSTLGTVVDLEYQGSAWSSDDCGFDREVLNETWQSDTRLHRVTVLLDTLITANEIPHTLYVNGAGGPADGVYTLSDRKIRGFPLWTSHKSYYSVFTSASSHRWCIGRDAESGAGRVLSEPHNGTMPHLIKTWLLSSATKADRGWMREPNITVSAKAEKFSTKHTNVNYGQTATHFRPLHDYDDRDDVSEAISFGDHNNHSHSHNPLEGSYTDAGAFSSSGAPLLYEDRRSMSPEEQRNASPPRPGYAPPALRTAGSQAALHYLPLLQGLWWTAKGVKATVLSLTVTFSAPTISKAVSTSLKMTPDGTVLLSDVALVQCSGEEVTWSDGDVWKREQPRLQSPERQKPLHPLQRPAPLSQHPVNIPVNPANLPVNAPVNIMETQQGGNFRMSPARPLYADFGANH